MKVLLVEDDDRVSAALSAVLARHGMAVRRLACGREAIRALEEVDWYCSIWACRTSMGWRCAGELRAAGDVPVINLTARGGVGERVLGLHAGQTTTWSSRSAHPPSEPDN